MSVPVIYLPDGWRVVHYDHMRQVLTLERERRFFKGAYWIVTVETLWRKDRGEVVPPLSEADVEWLGAASR